MSQKRGSLIRFLHCVLEPRQASGRRDPRAEGRDSRDDRRGGYEERRGGYEEHRETRAPREERPKNPVPDEGPWKVRSCSQQ